MNLLISKLLHWFAFGGTMFFAAAAGAIADVGAAPAVTPEPAAPAAAEPAPVTPAAPPSLSDIVKGAAERAEKELTKPAAEVPAAETPKPDAEAAKPDAEAAKPAEATKPAEVNPLDKIGALPAEKITAALAKASPETLQFLKDEGLSVEALADNARLAAQTTQYQEMFPSVEAGKEALTGAQNFWKLDQGLPAVQTLEGFDKFMMETLVPMSYLRDEAGNPIPDPSSPGAFKNDGSIGKLVDFSADVRDRSMADLAEKMLAAGGTEEQQNFAKDLKGALQFVGEFIKNGYKMPGEKVDTKTLPKDVQERLDRADKIEKESKDRETQTATQTYELNESKITDNTYAQLSPVVKQMLDGTAFSGKLKDHIANLAWTQVTESVMKESLYLRQRDQMSPAAKDYQQQRVALNLNYIKPKLVKIIEGLASDFGQPIVDANKARHEKLDSQAKAGQMEPRTSGSTPQTHTAASTPDDISKKALELARQTNPNAELGGREYFAAVMKLKQLPISA